MRRFVNRFTVAAGLVALVAIVVVIARLAGGGEPSRIPSGPGAVVTIDPTAGDDGVPSSESFDLGAETTVVAELATAFVDAWLQRSASPAEWHDSLAPLSTASLGEGLNGVDPTAVPATRMTGDIVVSARSEVLAEASAAVDTGMVTLTIIKVDGQWLVNGIDWEQL